MINTIISTISRRVALIRLRLRHPNTPNLQKILGCVFVSGTLTPYEFLALASVDVDVIERRMRWAVTAGLLCPAPETLEERNRRTDIREAPYMLTEAGVHRVIQRLRHNASRLGIFIDTLRSLLRSEPVITTLPKRP